MEEGTRRKDEKRGNQSKKENVSQVQDMNEMSESHEVLRTRILCVVSGRARCFPCVVFLCSCSVVLQSSLREVRVRVLVVRNR